MGTSLCHCLCHAWFFASVTVDSPPGRSEEGDVRVYFSRFWHLVVELYESSIKRVPWILGRYCAEIKSPTWNGYEDSEYYSVNCRFHPGGSIQCSETVSDKKNMYICVYIYMIICIYTIAQRPARTYIDHVYIYLYIYINIQNILYYIFILYYIY